MRVGRLANFWDMQDSYGLYRRRGGVRVPAVALPEFMALRQPAVDTAATGDVQPGALQSEDGWRCVFCRHPFLVGALVGAGVTYLLTR